MNFLGTLCLILVATTIAGHLSTKLNFPVVIGQLLVGVIIGPTFLNLIQANDFIKLFSEIGVVILMFMAGLESDLHLLLRFIKPSILVASTGMLLPLVSFYFIGLLFNLDNKESIFLGVIFAATSVSITVEVLKEMNQLTSQEDITILGAAVADDILSVILLSVFTSGMASSKIGSMLILQILFFIILLVSIRWIIPKLMDLSAVFEIPVSEIIMALILCFGLSYVADLMGLSAVIGSFFAGIAVGQTDYKKIINKGIQPIGYGLFIPVFFISIGLNVTFKGIIDDFLLFIILTIVGIISKTIGAGAGAKLFGFSNHSSLMIGFGMVSRGEMALIIAQIGFQSHLLSIDRYSAVISAIFVCTLIAPFLLKKTARL
ncbi:cation:proton antiporter [Oenococcus sicerae]|uniref:cation:proton antiporter n=1 Tax=Oenococcus sicerae TaxID=2203724 RepID=UPI0010B98559|nr:Na(+)/H(+) antiporter [Oenococcus sicerae]